MSVSIKVAVRCRPYTLDDKLGVHMTQTAETEGQIQIINSSYSTKRFAFSWSWWSAYGWQRHQKGDKALAEEMKLIHQGLAYKACGIPIRTDVLEGNAVVRCVWFVTWFVLPKISRRFVLSWIQQI